MSRCPNCKAEAPAGSRFCSECGARLDGDTPALQDQPTMPVGSQDAPLAAPTGKETILLGAPDIAPTGRLLRSQPAPPAGVARDALGGDGATAAPPASGASPPT